jgi:formylglycine-generating enzyme required for sulfatase activity
MSNKRFSISGIVVALGFALLICTQVWAADGGASKRSDAEDQATSDSLVTDLQKAISTKSGPAAMDILAELEKVAPEDGRIPELREKIEAFLIADLDNAISKEFTYTARVLFADLEKLSPEDVRIADLRERVAALPEREESLSVDLGGGVMIELLLIKPGTFTMGSETGIADEKPAKKVTISKPFYLGKYELTQSQWQAVIGFGPVETMARGVVERMKAAQAGQSAAVPVETIRQIVSDQWKAVVGDVSRAAPPAVIMSKAVEDHWTAEAVAAPESIDNMAMAKAIADQWKTVGGRTLASVLAEHVKEVLGADPKSVTVDTVGRVLHEQWEAAMGSNLVDMIANATAEKVKSSMGTSKLPISVKRAKSIVEQEWKAVMDADPYSSVPLEQMATAVTDQWKAAVAEAEANAVAPEKIQAAVVEQWKTEMTDELIEKLANATVERLKSGIKVEPDPEQLKKTKKALVKQWKDVLGADPEKADTIKKMTKAAEDQWKSGMVSVVTDKLAKGVQKQWKAIPEADPLMEMARIFTEEWKTMSGSDPQAVPMDKIENAVAARWKSVMGSDPIIKAARQVEDQWSAMPADNSRFDGANLPVDTVNWKDCQEYLQRLGCMFPADGFRLPTEAEWEYACRAGSTTEYSFGDDARSLTEFAWFKDNSQGTSHVVGEKKPNPWGLYDMYGNLFEWCLSPYKGYPFEEGDGGKDVLIVPHVVRGGFWGSDAEDCRSAFRLGYASSNRYFSYGCRIALSAE